MNVKMARIKKGYTQEYVCGALRISRSTIVRIERGEYDNIKLGKAKEFAELLDSTVQELFLS